MNLLPKKLAINLTKMEKLKGLMNKTKENNFRMLVIKEKKIERLKFNLKKLKRQKMEKPEKKAINH